MTYRRVRVHDSYDRVAEIQPIPCPSPPPWAADVSQAPAAWAPAAQTPLFAPPIPFVIPPLRDDEPFHPHNHCPSIAWGPNGDLLAVWFSTIREEGTEMTILASRLRQGRRAWDPAAEFFKAPDRNMTGSSIFYDEVSGLLHHINGMGREGVEGWGDLVLVHRTSRDSGVTWSAPRAVSHDARYQRRNQPIAGMLRTRCGCLLQLCDATDGGVGDTAVHISRDDGCSWRDAGGNIRGIHAGAVELADGRWLAFARGRDIDGRMPLSLSGDQGETWRHAASEFAPIGAAQRLALLRLREGPLLLLSFTGPRDDTAGARFVRDDGTEFRGRGLFAAVSEDDGQSWPVRRLLTRGEGTFQTGPYFGAKVRRPPIVTTTPDLAETEGYLAATQTPDGIIHLLSSRLHYRFNLAWVSNANPCR